MAFFSVWRCLCGSRVEAVVRPLFFLYLAAIIDISQRATDIFPSRFKLIVLPRGWDSLPVYLLHLHKFPAVSRCRGRIRRRRIIGKSKMYPFANKLCFLFSLAALVSLRELLESFSIAVASTFILQCGHPSHFECLVISIKMKWVILCFRQLHVAMQRIWRRGDFPSYYALEIQEQYNNN